MKLSPTAGKLVLYSDRDRAFADLGLSPEATPAIHRAESGSVMLAGCGGPVIKGRAGSKTDHREA